MSEEAKMVTEPQGMNALRAGDITLFLKRIHVLSSLGPLTKVEGEFFSKNS